MSLSLSFVIRLDPEAYTGVWALSLSIHELITTPLIYMLRKSALHPTPICTPFRHRRAHRNITAANSNSCTVCSMHQFLFSYLYQLYYFQCVAAAVCCTVSKYVASVVLYCIVELFRATESTSNRKKETVDRFGQLLNLLNTWK